MTFYTNRFKLIIDSLLSQNVDLTVIRLLLKIERSCIRGPTRNTKYHKLRQNVIFSRIHPE